MSVGSEPSGVFVSSANGLNFLNYSAGWSNDLKAAGIVFRVSSPDRRTSHPMWMGLPDMLLSSRFWRWKPWSDTPVNRHRSGQFYLFTSTDYSGFLLASPNPLESFPTPRPETRRHHPNERTRRDWLRALSPSCHKGYRYPLASARGSAYLASRRFPGGHWRDSACSSPASPRDASRKSRTSAAASWLG